MAASTATQTDSLVELPKSQTKHATTLHDLSDELLGLIIERVPRPSDLKNACLVSKKFHAIAVRSLYRNVALDLGGDHDTRLSSFLNPRNIGLQHIRQLRLYLAESADRCNQERQAQFATRMILEFLPEDVLEEFSWCPWKAFAADTLLLLYKRQRKMKWLEVMDLDRDVLPELKKMAKTTGAMFQHTRKLALYPENRDTLALSGFFLEKCREQLEELIVHCNFSDLGGPSVPDGSELNDSATEPGLLSRTVFSSLMPFDTCEPLKNLTSLRLHRISLRYCADTWCKFINFQQLENLRLYHCAGADTLLGQLSKSRNLPKTLKVLELQHRDNTDNEALLALDGFLCLVSGLRDMVIDLENVKSLPAAAGIVRHSKTLELLSVHCATENHPGNSMTSDCDNEELVWSTEDFDKICRACKDLEQLSCAWPSTSLIRSPAPDWKRFESSAAVLRKMVTLHITTWPNNKPSTQLLPRMVYESLLQNLAQRMFELAADGRDKGMPPVVESIDSDDEDDLPILPSGNTSSSAPDATVTPSSRLRLIAFGVSDRIYEREDSKNQVIFLKSFAADAEGKHRPHAVPVGWCLRQYIEPRSEVLDFVLHRSSDRDAHPPVSDYLSGTGRLRHTTGGWGDERDDED
ncbi:hypothetical protein CKM354_001137800 [Cercospora kikuchii]|uniref:F-box domain-containing protein n=1 Tax=Cercospora kikuchii TaxID=84275 RepID=A0A9P3CT07_9PEZI|nr:uncharacterized protein CKM354_001137800 [Cercospora kikuchii]GIZ48311.1 hypothetical protein CKM354_001137800 [Cercospora kikuchii]